jgi:hypothetical protein
MYRVLQDTSVESSVTKEEIHQTFLINRFSQDQSQKIRLKPIKDDRKAYNAIFEGKEIDTSNITINHKYFYDRVLEQEITIDQLYQAL